MYTILLLAEETLHDHDVTRVASLHGDDEVTVHVLVPADAEHNRLIEALDEVALGNLRDALDDDDPSPGAGRAGRHARRQRVGRPVHRCRRRRQRARSPGPTRCPPRSRRLALYDADEIIVVTPPHPLEDGLHRDWASRLRDKLKLPVLHIISGTDRVVALRTSQSRRARRRRTSRARRNALPAQSSTTGGAGA